VNSRAKLRVSKELDQISLARELNGRYYLVWEHQHLFIPQWLARLPVDNELQYLEPIQEEVDKRISYKAKLVERWQAQHLCRWCGLRGHFNKACLLPHTRCAGLCKVPIEHAYYTPKTCPHPPKQLQKPGRPKKLPPIATINNDLMDL